MNEIVEKRELAQSIRMFTAEASEIAGKSDAGQFVIPCLNDEGTRIPITIADADQKQRTVTLRNRDIGKSTRLLNRLNKIRAPLQVEICRCSKMKQTSPVIDAALAHTGCEPFRNDIAVDR
jgi:NAD(P)H-flavin reductase